MFGWVPGYFWGWANVDFIAFSWYSLGSWASSSICTGILIETAVDHKLILLYVISKLFQFSVTSGVCVCVWIDSNPCCILDCCVLRELVTGLFSTAVSHIFNLSIVECTVFLTQQQNVCAAKAAFWVFILLTFILHIINYDTLLICYYLKKKKIVCGFYS